MIATKRLAKREYPIVRAMSENSSLVTPSTKTIGRNTHTVVSVEAIIAPVTCTAPWTEAFAAGVPSLLRR